MIDCPQINYAVPNPSSDEIVALIRQREFGIAHGPKNGIGYLGTHGISPCVGVGLVAKELSGYPCIAVGHIDGEIEPVGSIYMMMKTLRHNMQSPKAVEAYLASEDPDQKLIDEVIDAIIQIKELTTISVDFTKGRAKVLAFNLKTGKPLDRSTVSKMDCFLKVGEAYKAYHDGVLKSVGEHLLSMELDLTKDTLPSQGFGIVSFDQSGDTSRVPFRTMRQKLLQDKRLKL